MTFEEARKRHIEELDRIYHEQIRLLASDPDWCNPMAKEHKEGMERFNGCLVKIVQLNNVEHEAKRGK